MIQVIDRGGRTLDITFHERDQRYLSQFSAEQLAEWLQEAMAAYERAAPWPKNV